MLFHGSSFFVSPEGMKMRGMKNETNGSAKGSKVVSLEHHVASLTGVFLNSQINQCDGC